VMWGFRMASVVFSGRVPETRKTTIRGPSALHAARRLPGIGFYLAG